MPSASDRRIDSAKFLTFSSIGSPIGATLVRPEWHRKAYGSMERFDLHGATFAGNALSCAAAELSDTF